MSDPITHLLSAWPIAPPWRVQPSTEGANNRTALVETANGHYIVRRYPAAADLTRIAFEHAVLHGLQSAGLPFAVPRPRLTTSGQTIVCPPPDDGGPTVLFEVIRGRSPVVVDPPVAYRSGWALGELDDALSRLVVTGQVAPPPFGDLVHTHPRIADPTACVSTLPIPAEARRCVQALFEHLIVFQADTYARLPLQVILTDFDPSNVLFAGARVTGVLDFEFAAPAPRAMDLAIGLQGFGGPPGDTAPYWDRFTAFAAGYQYRGQVTDITCSCLPDLMRLREATSLVHRMGRWLDGTTTDQDLATRVNRFLRLDAALVAIGPELTRRVATASIMCSRRYRRKQ